MITEDLLELYRRMRLSRHLDHELARLWREGAIRGPMHTSTGQEAAGVGATAVLRPGDVVTLTHRPHAQYVGLGVPLGPCVAEMMGRATGLSGGRAGHMIISDVDHGVLGASGVVGHSLLLAAGHGYAQKLAGRGAVTLCVTGDGSVNSGAFNEALNMAALWQLPVVVLIENNQYGLTVRLDRHVRETNLSLRAHGYGIPSTRVDGNDVEAVCHVVQDAVARARAGDGPSLIEAATYRTGPFSMSDRGGYRQDAEGDVFADPLEVTARRLRERGVTASALAEVDQAAAQEIATAIEFALASPWPDPAEMRELARIWDGGPV